MFCFLSQKLFSCLLQITVHCSSPIFLIAVAFSPKNWIFFKTKISRVCYYDDNGRNADGDNNDRCNDDDDDEYDDNGDCDGDYDGDYDGDDSGDDNDKSSSLTFLRLTLSLNSIIAFHFCTCSDH